MHHTSPAAERPTERLKRVAAARVAFRSIVVPYQPQEEFMAACEEVRLVAEGNQGGQLTAIQMLAHWGTGKTVGAQRFVDGLLARGEHPDGSTPAVIARLDTSGKAASVPTAILRALGAFRPDHGPEDLRWTRALAELEEHRTHLLIIDETNRASRRPSVSPFIADACRDLLDAGLVGIAFLGTTEAADMFAKCPALLDRLDAPVEMRPLDWTDDADLETASEFLAAMDEAVMAAGLLDEPMGVTDVALLQPLVEASSGLVRRLCGILERAICAAEGDRSRVVGKEGLADVVDQWIMRKGQIAHNPLRGA